MSDSVYRKTHLPVRLNLNDRNTGDQLKAPPGPENGRGALESASKEDSVTDCNEVMRKDLRDWLKNHGIDGPPPSPEAEQRAMWAWIRDFHKEYTEDWFTRNMPRLRDQFRPIFNGVLKEMKQASQPPAAVSSTATGGAAIDLLDMGACSLGPSSGAPATPDNSAAAGDLLSLGPETAQPAAPSAAPAPVASGAAVDLLNFGSLAQPVAPPPPPTPADCALAGDLFSLGSLSSPAHPAVPSPTPVPAGSAAAGDLLSLGSLDPMGSGRDAGKSDDPLAGLLM